MPKITVKLHRMLRRDAGADAKDLEATPIDAVEGESVLDLVRRLAAQDEFVRTHIYDEAHQMIETNIVTILNGRLVNPHERGSTALREGDELVFVSMFYGG